MPNHPSIILPIPRETIRSAKAVFGPGNFYIQVGERLVSILDDIHFDCFSKTMGISSVDAAILSLVSFFEFMETLTDDQAMDAVRTRIDWKYALHLPVNPPVFHQNILCEFRYQILVNSLGLQELQKLVDRLAVLNPPVNHRFQNFEIRVLFSALCSDNRLSWSWQAMQQTLAALARKHPRWLRQVALPHWYARFNDLSFGSNPAESVRQVELSIEELRSDVHYLLEEVQRSNSSAIQKIPEIQTLHRILELQHEMWSPQLHSPNGNPIWLGCSSCINRAG